MTVGRARGWWYPWLFVGGMLIVIAVNAVLVVIAVRTFPGLTAEDAYRRGLAYNRTIAAAAAQDARGWRLDLTVSPPSAADAVGNASAAQKAPGALAVVARFVDRAGQPLSRLAVNAILVRPLGAGNDITLTLEETGGGVYRGSLTTLIGGQWDVRIHARRGDETFQQTRRLVLR
jgi:nitrogen fixation protein FixH